MATAELNTKLSMGIKITIELTLEEAKALNEMTGYGADSFLQGYYKQLGKSYMQPHEKGVRSLFETIKKTLPYKIHDADTVIKAVNDLKNLNGKISLTTIA